MGGLRDQLLKSGLVTEKQIKKAQQQKRKENQKQQGKPGAGPDESRRRMQDARAEKTERDRQLNLQRAKEAEKRAVAAQVKQLVESNLQPKGDGEVAFNFADGDRVKRIYVSDAVRAQIARGQLAIVRLDRQYELVPAEVADKIRERDAEAVVLRNEPPQKSEPEDKDDPYAGYEVPDDLLW